MMLRNFVMEFLPYSITVGDQAWVDKVRSLYGEKAETYL